MKSLIPGPAGQLEIDLTEGDGPWWLVCHPHPQFGGNMDNKVVVTLARALSSCGMKVIRFNYRGVGMSEGSYGSIIGESADAKAVMSWASNKFGPIGGVAGFSFGSYIAAQIEAQEPLIMVAPPCERMPFSQCRISEKSLIIHGSKDEICSYDQSKEFASQRGIEFIALEGASHFFHGALPALKCASISFLSII